MKTRSCGVSLSKSLIHRWIRNKCIGRRVLCLAVVFMVSLELWPLCITPSSLLSKLTRELFKINIFGPQRRLQLVNGWEQVWQLIHPETPSPGSLCSHTIDHSSISRTPFILSSVMFAIWLPLQLDYEFLGGKIIHIHFLFPLLMSIFIAIPYIYHLFWKFTRQKFTTHRCVGCQSPSFWK